MPLSLGRFFAEFSQHGLHAFASAKVQGADPTKVSKNEWNAAHLLPDCEMGVVAGLYVETALPGATEAFTAPENRWQKRLAQATQIRLQATVIEAVAAALVLEYTTDLIGAGGWTPTGASVSLATSGPIVGPWAAVPVGAQAPAGVLLRWVISA